MNNLCFSLSFFFLFIFYFLFFLWELLIAASLYVDGESAHMTVVIISLPWQSCWRGIWNAAN
jgi:hypothetical protein